MDTTTTDRRLTRAERAVEVVLSRKRRLRWPPWSSANPAADGAGAGSPAEAEETADRDYEWWPNPAANPNEKVLEGKIEVRKSRVQQEIDAEKAWHEADNADLARHSTALNSIATGALERARGGAEAVIKAAASIATLYTGVLALVFSVADNPLPLRGVLPAVFLGGAVVLATAYLAYGRTRTDTRKSLKVGPMPDRDLLGRTIWRYRTTALIVGDVVGRRQGALRASVVSLGYGLACLPLPFITLGKPVDPTWPPATLAPGEELELAKLRYAAEVTHAAEQAGVVRQEAWIEFTIFAGVLGVGIVLVLLTLALSDRTKSDEESQSHPNLTAPTAAGSRRNRP